MTRLVWLCLLLVGCAETRIYDRGQLACVIQGDATNITFNTGNVYFHADTLSHSTATAASYTGATSLVGGVAAGIVSGVGVIK